MLCSICGLENGETATSCQSCGSRLAGTEASDAPLGAGTRLFSGRYSIGKLLGQGGFGITYLGSNVSLRRPVAIKEYFPYGSGRRGTTVVPASAMKPGVFTDCRQRFLEEACTLARFHHPGIVQVHDSFEENNTAYMVMEYVRGRTLTAVMEDRGRLPEREVLVLAEQLVAALAVVHAEGYLHRDVKPDNVLLAEDGRAVLLDFGTARQYVSNATLHMTAFVTPGYAPLEQYGQKARFGTFTDVYALAATLYHLLTGEMPTAATDRVAGVDMPEVRELNPSISHRVSWAIAAGMSVRVDERPATMKEFLEELQGSTPAAHQRWKAASIAWLQRIDDPVAAPTGPSAAPASAVPPSVPPGLRFLCNNKDGYAEFENAKDGSTLILVPATQFMMGSGERDCTENERPGREVTSRAYYIGRAPVTTGQFRRFVAETQYRASGGWDNQAADSRHEDCPVTGVSWYDALAYCEWAGLRLLMEHEWELAAKGPQELKWPWGNAWNSERLAWARTAPAKERINRYPGASPVGCIDMAGNVWEWCSSLFLPYPYRETDHTTTHKQGADKRVIRGGSYRDSDPSCFRGTYRVPYTASQHHASIGFRGARSAE